LSMHLVDLERVHVLEVVLLWLEVMLHLRLEWVERDRWVSSVQTTMHRAFRCRH
jgi:hypothetical protein